VAVDDVSVSLAPGSRVGLVGPSGSGKSTLGRVLALLLEPDRGGVTIDGSRAAAFGVGAPRELRHRVQLVFQSPRLAVDPRLRLEDAILEPLAASGRAVELEDWPARVGLTADLLRRFPHEVSEGQLQRACLARALIVRPRYLICDELSSMLDVSTQAALLETIAGVDGLGVLLITHDRVLADTWCERVVEIRELETAQREEMFSANSTIRPSGPRR
jgi:peptide/nickel transport system ATP-binding protein